MKLSIIFILSLFLLPACTQKSELDEAKKKIAELQSQLELERAKTEATPNPESPTPMRVNSPEPSMPLGSQWNYTQAEDPMTGGMTYHAVVLSSNTVEFGFPYAGEQHAKLHLRTDPKYGKDLMFGIERGQILCNSYENCTVLVRFDDEKAANYSATGASDNSTETIFIINYGRFIEKLLKAKRVRISTNIYQQGSPIFEFDVSAFDKDKYKPKH